MQHHYHNFSNLHILVFFLFSFGVIRFADSASELQTSEPAAQKVSVSTVFTAETELTLLRRTALHLQLSNYRRSPTSD